MFGMFKKMLGGNSVQTPEVEMEETFKKLMSANQAALRSLQVSIIKFYELLNMDTRLGDLVMANSGIGKRDRADELLFLERVFKMEGEFLAKGMNAESVAAKFIALNFACHSLDSGSIKVELARKRSIRIFEHFKDHGSIDLDPPRKRRHLSVD